MTKGSKIFMISQELEALCPGFGWDGVNFLSSTWCVLDFVSEECW